MTDNIAKWLWAMRNHVGPKIVTGLRGIGKSAQLTAFANQLLADGVPREKILVLDGESPLACRLTTCERTLDYITARTKGNDKTYVLIREASAFPNLETTLGALAAFPRFNVFVTASSRHMLTAGLADYLDGRLAHFECRPQLKTENPKEISRIWREALLYDVHTPIRQPFNTQVINTLACHLSDNVGGQHSLRSISAAISPTSSRLSPHTIDNYLTALCDSYLIVKCLRYDLAEESVMKSQFRCFFTSPAIRMTIFGEAPKNEARCSLLNAAWLKLYLEYDDVYTASSSSGHVDFVSRKGSSFKLWKVNGQRLSEVSRNSFVAG